MTILLDNTDSLSALILPWLGFNKSMAWVLIGVFLWLVSACNSQTNLNKGKEQPKNVEESVEKQVILENATLEQVDSNGKRLWQLDVNEVVYRQNQQIAELEQVKGTLYQDGKAFLELEANQGKIIKNGEKVKLQGEVIATDKRNDTVFRSEKLEWFPEDNLIVMPQSIKAQNSRFRGSADEAQYQTKKQKLTLTGNVKGNSNDPALELTGKQIKWLIEQDLVQSDYPLQLRHYKQGTEIIKERVTANSGKVNLAKNVVSLTDNVNLKSIAPAVRVTSNAMTWYIQKQLVRSNQPLKLVHLEDEITLTGNQGELDLETEIAQFEGNVEAINQANQATLSANRLRWNLATHNMEAQSNVTYQQSKPPINTEGEQATGNLQKETITVQGKAGAKVTTEFKP